MNELTLENIRAALEQLPKTNLYYIDSLNEHGEMPDWIKERIEWALDHIYISDNLEEVR